jgi:hypothetical protein
LERSSPRCGRRLKERLRPDRRRPLLPKQPTYMLVQFMKVPEGKMEEWVKLEREWKPLHELRVKEGAMLSWAAIAQGDAGRRSERAGLRHGDDLSRMADPTQLNFEELFKRAYRQGDMNAISPRTQSARSIVRSEIWEVLDQTEPPATGTK